MDSTVTHPSLTQLEQALEHIQASPKQAGRIDGIVRRPATNEREALAVAKLDETHGLNGDCWYDQLDTAKKRDKHLNSQITLMNSRVIDVIAQDRERWALAGDQLYVDFDLSDANLPPGTRLALADAILEVTAEPHLGCRKFQDRFGKDAVAFVNSKAGQALNLRGVNARIVRSGEIQVGDTISRLAE